MQTGALIVVVVVLVLGFTVFFGAPYVPSRRKHIDDAFRKLYKLSSKDVLVDLGSGDGVVLRAASKYGARAIGYELSPPLAWLSQFLSRNDPNVRVRCVNMWRAHFPADTTVVYMFGDSRDIKKYLQKVRQEAVRLDKALFVISYGFMLPEHEPIRQHGAYHLYEIAPLLTKKPQV